MDLKQNYYKFNSIEALRFFFMAILVSHHAGFSFTRHGYLVVEFFFMLSGFLIYNSLLRHNKSTIDYTFGKLKRTYSEYAVACIIAFLLFGIIPSIKHETFSLEIFFKILPELLLVQNIGIFDGGFNTPLWYYSVLVWGGGGIYLLMKINKEIAIKIILPVVTLLTYTYIFNKSDCIQLWEGCIPLLRGISAMSLGVILSYSKQKIRFKTSFCNIVSIISLSLYITIMIISPYLDKYCLILIPFILSNAFCENSILNIIFKSSIWSRLGAITYEMYVIHVPLNFFLWKITNYIELDIKYNILLFILYLIILCICSFFFKQFCKRIILFK